MEQCRGGCSHEMVMSPATATTMAYPTEEEKRSHRRIGGVNGDDNDEDDDVVRGSGNREERSRDLGACRVCDFKSDRDFDGPELCSSNHSNGSSKKVVIDTSNSDFICSEQSLFSGIPNAYEWLPGLSPTPRNVQALRLFQLKMLLDWEKSSCNDEKENQEERPHKRRRKQSVPKQVICQQNSRKLYVIRILRLRNVKDALNQWRTSSKVAKFTNNEHHQTNLRQNLRRLKCHKCPQYAPARGKNRHPYHTRTSLILHTLWRHKRRSRSIKTQSSKITLPSIVSSITLKATFFTRPNYSYR